jgi:hypothetical protein
MPLHPVYFRNEHHSPEKKFMPRSAKTYDSFAEEQSHFRHQNTTIRQVHAIVSGTVQNNRQTASKHVPDRRSSVKRNKRSVQHDQLEILPPTRRINPQEVPTALFQGTSIVLSAPTLRGAPTIRAHPPFWRIHHSGAFRRIRQRYQQQGAVYLLRDVVRPSILIVMMS